jgi:hypothetical protein
MSRFHPIGTRCWVHAFSSCRDDMFVENDDHTSTRPIGTPCYQLARTEVRHEIHLAERKCGDAIGHVAFMIAFA